MKLQIVVLAAALAALPALASSTSASRVDVVFQNPESFTDVRDSFSGTDKSRENYLALIKEHLEKQAPRHLAAGQTLTITFTDVDMAGSFEGQPDVRIIKDIYPARLKFSFKVTDAAGSVVKEGTRNLVDTEFQTRAGASMSRDVLFYEKGLLNDWLKEDFGHPKKSS